MLCHSYVEFWLFESNNKEKSPECFIELTLIAKNVVNLRIIVVSYFMVNILFYIQTSASSI